MSDTLRDRIAAVAAAHEPVTDYNGATGECIECDLNPRWPDADPTGVTDGWRQHSSHLADVVIAELRPELCCEICGRTGTQKFTATRTGWVCRSIHACNRRAGR